MPRGIITRMAGRVRPAIFSFVGLVGSTLVAAPPALGPSPAGAVVFRHDRSDSAAIALGAPFAAVGRLVPDGSGTLIAPTWVATAAHVAARVRAGSTIAFGESTATVKRVVIHPEGTSKPGVPPEVDLALVELDAPVVGIEPVALYRGRDELGKTLTIVGSGDFGNPRAPLARADGRRRAVTNVVSDAGPRRFFLRFDAPPAGTASEGVGGPGDSGGPALWEHDGKIFLVGVSSASMDGKPGQYGVTDVYTRVGSYVRWIDETMMGSREKKSP